MHINKNFDGFGSVGENGEMSPETYVSLHYHLLGPALEHGVDVATNHS